MEQRLSVTTPYSSGALSSPLFAYRSLPISRQESEKYRETFDPFFAMK